MLSSPLMNQSQIISDPARRPMEAWVVYYNLEDHPNQFVVRRLRGGPPRGEDVAVSMTYESAVKVIPAGLARIPRLDSDDSEILETWI
jgi:hypothetical protein